MYQGSTISRYSNETTVRFQHHVSTTTVSAPHFTVIKTPLGVSTCLLFMRQVFFGYQSSSPNEVTIIISRCMVPFTFFSFSHHIYCLLFFWLVKISTLNIHSRQLSVYSFITLKHFRSTLPYPSSTSVWLFIKETRQIFVLMCIRPDSAWRYSVLIVFALIHDGHERLKIQ